MESHQTVQLFGLTVAGGEQLTVLARVRKGPVPSCPACRNYPAVRHI